MIMNRRIFAAVAFTVIPLLCFAQKRDMVQGVKKVDDVIVPLEAGKIRLNGYFDNDIHNSIDNWSKGVMPYEKATDFFRKGRKMFALGEMPAKAIRSNSMMYRYTGDPELKAITKKAVYDLLSTVKSNGSISCTPVEQQPGVRDGDIWERKYVLLGLSQYYRWVEQDPKVLEAMINEANSIVDQVGPSPKKEISTLGWSVTRIESYSVLEPMMRLYFLTGDNRYLDFAKYIVDDGGCKGKNIFEEVLAGYPMYEVGLPYPKAYEMTSVFEGLAEYYRATGDAKWLDCLNTFYDNVRNNEITIIGNAGSDYPRFPQWRGEAWNNTHYEQTNPDIQRSMETCVGVTWMKFCSQMLRLTGESSTVDEIERYIYNGLLGAMRPDGKGFSYVNRLNGEKVTNSGWGWNFDGLPVTCCNLNGPMGLAYIPFVAVMQAKSGPVVNLYNALEADAHTAKGHKVGLKVRTVFPKNGKVEIEVNPEKRERFDIKLRIPSWSRNTVVRVNGRLLLAEAGKYLNVNRKWKKGDIIELDLDMEAVLMEAPKGSNPKGAGFRALRYGPIVLARDENIDPDFDKAVNIIASPDGKVGIVQVEPTRKGTRLEFIVPTSDGNIRMVDYSSVDCWEGKRITTWLPVPEVHQ